MGSSKIWGAIVNGSRSWGTNVKGYVGNQFLEDEQSEKELSEITKDLFTDILLGYIL